MHEQFIQCSLVLDMTMSSVPDLGSDAFYPPGYGLRIWDELFPDRGSRIPDFAPEPIRSKNKVSLHPTFHVGFGIPDEKNFGSGIRNVRIPDTV
jgi:hypothetical protein